MPTGGQIRGMLLEEIILNALRTAGYDTILAPDNVRMFAGPSGLEIVGRGANHLIDAIADYSFQPPFSHPQRLLVEAKCYWGNVQLEVIRNAVGVHKDLSEAWTIPLSGEQRFHYQHAVFAASDFSTGAQDYAFAHDIYLFPLRRSGFFQPILKEIWRTRTRQLTRRRVTPVSLSAIRQLIRTALRERSRGRQELNVLLDEFGAGGAFDGVLDAASGLDGVLFASTKSGFLVMLVPDLGLGSLPRALNLARRGTIRIRAERKRSRWIWFIENEAGSRLFTLDIPPELFRRFVASDGSLDRRRFANVKTSELSVLQVPYRLENEAGIARLQLDRQWIEEIQRDLDV